MGIITELKRRNVFRVTTAYVVMGWLVIQVVETIFPAFGFGDTAVRVVVVAFALGLLPTLTFAWIFELTPEGLKQEKDVDRSQSIAPQTGKRLDRMIILVLLLALAYFAVDKFLLSEFREAYIAEMAREEGRSQARVEFLGDKSVAVLPFANMSGDPANESFTVGVHDELVTHISRFGSIRTISRYSTSQYRDSAKNTAQIAEELGVATILKGGIQRVVDQVRVNVQLIDAASNAYLWAETYDRELTVANIFAIQSEIARSIAVTLDLALATQQGDQLQPLPTSSLHAYDVFLTGNEFLARPISQQNIQTAMQMYERAVELDSTFAAAWAKLSLCHSNFYWFRYDRSEPRLQQARKALARARELNPDLPAAYIAAGYFYYYGFRDYETALRELAKAESLLPGDAQVIAAQGYIQRKLGQWNDAVNSLERAIVLDPRNAALIQSQADTFERLGRYEQAQHYFDRALMLAPDSAIVMFKRAFLAYNISGDTSVLREFLLHNPGSMEQASDYVRWFVEFMEGDYAAALNALQGWQSDVFSFQLKFFPRALLEGLSYQYLGDGEAARMAFQSALAYLRSEVPLPSDEPRISIAYGMATAGLGEAETAIRHAKRALELVESTRERGLAPYYQQDIVFVLSMAGEDDAAIALLSTYLAEPSNTTLTALRTDPRIARLESHPGFEDLVRKSSLLNSSDMQVPGQP